MATKRKTDDRLELGSGAGYFEIGKRQYWRPLIHDARKTPHTLGVGSPGLDPRSQMQTKVENPNERPLAELVATWPWLFPLSHRPRTDGAQIQCPSPSGRDGQPLEGSASERPRRSGAAP